MNSKDSKQIIERVIGYLESLKLRSCGIAVSGGSDSMALFHILTDWKSDNKPKIFVASIDHGLRSESKSEVEFVKKICETKKIEHVALTPDMHLSKVKGNLQNNARSARYQLLKNWAISKNLQCVLIGHTLDDQEENLLMRFFRGSGVDGLAGMEKKSVRNGILWVRPLLKVRKEELRNYLRNRSYRWIDDPSNCDDKYQRIKIRKLLQQLRSTRLISPNFVKTTDHMLRASKLSREIAVSNAKTILSFNDVGQIIFKAEKFTKLSEDTQYRIIAGIISWFSGRFYKPRFSQLEKIHHEVIYAKNLKGVMLGGTVFKKRNGIVTVMRELAAVKENYFIENEKFIWDNRWLITLKQGIRVKLHVKPFGLRLPCSDELKICFKSDFDKSALATMPMITTDKEVKFVPLSNLKYSVEVKLLNQSNEFYKFF